MAEAGLEIDFWIPFAKHGMLNFDIYGTYPILGRCFKKCRTDRPDSIRGIDDKERRQ